MKRVALRVLAFLLSVALCGAASSTPVPTPVPSRAVPRAIAPMPPSPNAVYDGPLLVALCYHQFGAKKDGGDPTYRVEPEEYAWQIDFLKKSGWKFVTLRQVEEHWLRGGRLPDRSVLLTFDDGFRSIYTRGWPIMRSAKVPGALFLYSDFLKAQGAALKYDDLAVMEKGGMAIGSHSRSHPNLAQWKDRMKREDYRAALKDEMEKSRDFLGEKTCYIPNTLAYPFGVYNDEVVAAARDAGYRLAFTVDPGPNDRTVNALHLRRELVTAYTSRKKFASYFERKVLHLADLSPAPGAVQKGRDVKIAARLLDDVDPSSVNLFLGEKPLKDFRYDPVTRVVSRKARMPIFRAGHLLTVQARDHSGVLRTFSWYFRVRHLKGARPGEKAPKGVDLQKPASDTAELKM